MIDIILVGSSSSYFYTETSDFDIKILLDFSKNKAIGSNIKTLLKILNNTYYSTSVKLRLYKRYIDFRFSENDNFVIGNYSLLHNKWNVKPRHDFDVAHIQSAELVRKFYSRTAETYRIFSQLVSENGIFAKSEIQKLPMTIQDIFQTMFRPEPTLTIVWPIFCHSSSSAKRIF